MQRARWGKWCKEGKWSVSPFLLCLSVQGGKGSDFAAPFLQKVGPHPFPPKQKVVQGFVMSGDCRGRFFKNAAVNQMSQLVLKHVHLTGLKKPASAAYEVFASKSQNHQHSSVYRAKTYELIDEIWFRIWLPEQELGNFQCNMTNQTNHHNFVRYLIRQTKFLYRL